MNLKVVSIADNAVQILIDKEDYSVADIVHRELLNVKHVKFAGVPPPHPLLKTLTVQVHTDGTSPMKPINEAVELARARIAELLKEANVKFPKERRSSVPVTEMGSSASTEHASYSVLHSTSEETSEEGTTIDAQTPTGSSP